MLEDGLSEAIENLLPVYLTLASGDKIELRIEDASISSPTVPAGTIGVKNHRVYPTECRQRTMTYKGKINLRVGWSINGRKQESFDKNVGEVPIMLKVILKFL